MIKKGKLLIGATSLLLLCVIPYMGYAKYKKTSQTQDEVSVLETTEQQINNQEDTKQDIKPVVSETEIPVSNKIVGDITFEDISIDEMKGPVIKFRDEQQAIDYIDLSCEQSNLGKVIDHEKYSYLVDIDGNFDVSHIDVTENMFITIPNDPLYQFNRIINDEIY